MKKKHRLKGTASLFLAAVLMLTALSVLLIAVPLLNCCQIVASRVPAWSKLAKLLGN